MYRFIIATLVTICIAYIVSLASPSALAAPATKPAADDTPLGIAPPSKDTASTILPVTAKFTEYRDEKRGFKVSYPDGWKKRDVSKDTEFLEFVASEPDDDEMIVEVLRIGHLPVYAHSDLDGTVKRLKESFQRGPNGPFEFISEDDVKLAGNPAREIVMIGNDHVGTSKLKAISVVGIVGGEAWTFTIGTTPRRFSRMSRLFEHVVSSFELIKPTIAVPAMAEFADAAHGVKLKYPAGWQKIAPASPKIIFSLSSEGAVGEVGGKKNASLPTANVNLVYSTSPRPAKGKLEDVLDQTMETNEKQVQKQFPDVKWISLTTISPTGASARKLVYSAKANGSDFQVLQVLAMTSTGATYTLTITTAAADYQQLLPIFEVIINSLQIRR